VLDVGLLNVTADLKFEVGLRTAPNRWIRDTLRRFCDISAAALLGVTALT